MKPIVLDLGRQKSKRIKRLKDGEGPLMDQVEAAVLQAKPLTGGKDILPVVIVYQRKSRKRGVSFMAPY